MSNLLLALEKLKAARAILDAADSYNETANRLIAEASKLTMEAQALVDSDKMSEVDPSLN